MLSLTIWGALSAFTIWTLIVTVASCIFVFYAIRIRQLPPTGYNHLDMLGIVERIRRGEEVFLIKITDAKLFKSFLFEMDCDYPDVTGKLLYRAPNEKCAHYVIKIDEEDFLSPSGLLPV